MSRNPLAAVMLAFLCLAPSGCSDTIAPNAPRFVQHAKNGCAGTRTQAERNLQTPYLQGTEYADGRLTLMIWFEANCCPDFATIVSTGERLISIRLVDTLHGCRCFCPYEDSFLFEGVEPGDLRIIFCSTTEIGYPESACFDTTIVLPE